MKTIRNSPETIKELRAYFGISEACDEKAICWTLIEAAFKSRANTAIIPLQDVLCLGSEARMNTPNTIGGRNWSWRLETGLLTAEIEEKLCRLSVMYDRNKE